MESDGQKTRKEGSGSKNCVFVSVGFSSKNWIGLFFVWRLTQVFQLESTFDMKRYLSSSERAGLAASLSLTETQVSELYLLYFFLLIELVDTIEGLLCFPLI